jgi:multisubunit Na+/H+ antiporter MnhF subunit
MEAFNPVLQVIFFVVLGLSLVPMMYRVIKGPHVLDRVMCIDAITLVVICLIAVWKIAIGTTYFFDAVLVLTIVGFVTTVALAKYLENGDLVE